MERITVQTVGGTYDILVKRSLFKSLPEIFKEKYKGRKLALVTDSNVFDLYGQNFENELKKAGLDVVSIVFKAGEENKNLHTLQSIYNSLADNGFTRSDYVIALGGGVTGDMAGFAAATFLRGLKFIQVPTTLLAMVDSSIGGKVAVDLPKGKNLVGAFHQPEAVFIDPELLSTLSDRYFADGMAELIKHSFIRSIELYQKLSELSQKVRKEGLSSLRESLSDSLDLIIAESCRIKRDIVNIDEKDNGIRQLLNFGHTIGHGIERVQNYTGFSHGEAVSAGMVLMTKITESMGLTQKGEAHKLAEILKSYNLPVSMPDIDVKELIDAIRLDKKNRSGKITISYIEEIGQGRLFEMELNELEERIHGILNNNSFAS